jgi:hypothetical protein
MYSSCHSTTGVQTYLNYVNPIRYTAHFFAVS